MLSYQIKDLPQDTDDVRTRIHIAGRRVYKTVFFVLIPIRSYGHSNTLPDPFCCQVDTI